MVDLTKEMILDILHQNREKIRSFGVKRLVLFGSYARDEQKENSDIDFLVEFEDYNIDNHLNLKYFLEDLFDRKIDLVKPHLVREELKEDILGGVQYGAKI